MIKKLALIFVAVVAIVLIGCPAASSGNGNGDGPTAPVVSEVIEVTVRSTEFTVTITNVSTGAVATPLAPGVFAVHDADTAPVFKVGEAASAGLELLAEDGTTGTLNTALTANNVVTAFGTVGTAGIGPAGTFVFEFNAAPGDRLSFATMYVESNDLFFGPAEATTGVAGIELFPSGTAVDGDITSMIRPYDAGTEVDETLHSGGCQPERQNLSPGGTANCSATAADSGTSGKGAKETDDDATSEDDTKVQVATDDNVMFAATQTAANVVTNTIKVEISSAKASDFTVTIKNISGDLDPLDTPLAPGVFAVHDNTVDPLFEVNEAASAGLELLAEDGVPGTLDTEVTVSTTIKAKGIFNTPIGDSGAGPATPGKSYQFSITPTAGDRLSFAVMYVESNDLFFGPVEATAGVAGIPLFTGTANTAISGDITSQILLYDAGTEADEELHTGGCQPERQSDTTKCDLTGVDSGTSGKGAKETNDPATTEDDTKVQVVKSDCSNIVCAAN